MEMKNSVRIIVITLSLVLIALVPAHAQKTSATVNIPFSFAVDNVRLPAGEYIISSSIIALRSGGAYTRLSVAG